MLSRIRKTLDEIYINEGMDLNQFYKTTDFYGEFAKWVYENIPNYVYKDFNKSPIGDLIDLYADIEGIDVWDIDLKSKDFLKWLYEEVGSALDDTYLNIKSDIGGKNSIFIYRAMRIEGDYIKHLIQQGKHLGICWSRKREEAVTYEVEGKSGYTYILESEVFQTSVDWRYTLLQNWISPREYEIRLFKSIPLKIKNIYKNPFGIPSTVSAKKLDITSIKDKVFYA